MWQLEAHLLSDPLPLDELSSESESESLLSLSEESVSLSSLLLLSSDPACGEQPQMRVCFTIAPGCTMTLSYGAAGRGEAAEQQRNATSQPHAQQSSGPSHARRALQAETVSAGRGSAPRRVPPLVRPPAARR